MSTSKVFALGQPPVDNPDQVRRRGDEEREPDLAACGIAGLQHDHTMPALTEDPRRLQPGRPAPTTNALRGVPLAAATWLRQPVFTDPVAGLWMHLASRAW
jgi:hypothetical protein